MILKNVERSLWAEASEATMRRIFSTIFSTLSVLFLVGCVRYRDDVDYDFPVEYVWHEQAVGHEFSLFQGVWWDRGVAEALEPVIRGQAVVDGRSVLDLYSGPGVIAVLCGLENAKSVLSVAESGAARACARYNTAACFQDSVVTVRDLDLARSPVLPPTSQFEVIFATLAESADLRAADLSLDRKIQIFVECIRGNLSASGRVFALCENDAVNAKLAAVCREEGLSVTSLGNGAATVTAWEVKVPAKPASGTVSVPLPANNDETESDSSILSTK